MIKEEYVLTRADGVEIHRHYSDEEKYIIQVETGIKYEIAEDICPCEYTYIESDEYLVKLAKDIKTDSKVHTGVIASGDIFVNDPKMSNKINTKFNALCTEMEGASIAQVCYLSHVPFLVIRSISDSVNGNNELTYDDFLLLSSKMVAKFVNELLKKIG